MQKPVKQRPGLYRVGKWEVHHQPNDTHERSKPWVLSDASVLPKDGVGRYRTCKEAFEQIQIIEIATGG